MPVKSGRGNAMGDLNRTRSEEIEAMLDGMVRRDEDGIPQRAQDVAGDRL